jgi:CheY-like chemotaxis protein
MPVMDGVELVRRLRSAPATRGLKVLLVSTESDPGRIAAALAAGADEYLAKPFTPEALARKLVALGVCTAAEATTAGDRGPIRVLVVDDSATIRSLLSANLAADPDIKVAGTAVNGRVALASIAAAAPAIVLLDVEMPVLDGISTLREIRKTHPKLPVLMFSSLTERGSKATLDALLAGVDAATDPAARVAVHEWLMFQMGGFGPMPGQVHHFIALQDETDRRYGLARFMAETRRLYGVMDRRLAAQQFFAGELSIADFAILGWVWRHARHQVDLADFPNVQRWYQALMARPGVARGFAVALKTG